MKTFCVLVCGHAHALLISHTHVHTLQIDKKVQNLFKSPFDLDFFFIKVTLLSHLTVKSLECVRHYVI